MRVFAHHHLYGRLHPLDCEEGSEIGREGGEHEYDEEPVGGNEDATREGLGALSAALRGQGGQGEPETLTNGEVAGSFWVRGPVSRVKHDIFVGGHFRPSIMYHIYVCVCVL